MKVLYMGTPDFAVNTLNALIKSDHEIIGVITQPDRPKGRGKHVIMTPVKEAALQHHLPVFQPEKVKNPEFVQKIKEMAPDIIVVVAFGQILSRAILEIPVYGCINVHGSLLPKYRGAAPIQWAVINNEATTGVTIQQMVYELDAGDILLAEEIILAPNETAGSLYDRLSIMSGNLVVETLKRIELKAIDPKPQNHEEATYAKMLDKHMGLIEWSKDAKTIECLVRGLNPWPSAYTYLDGVMIKIWDAQVVRQQDNVLPGTIVSNQKGITIQCGQNQLKIKELQLQGKKRMDAVSFINGHHLTIGTQLG